MKKLAFVACAAAFAALPPLSALGSISPASVHIRRSEEQQSELIDKWDEATGLVTPQDYKQYLRDGKTRGFKALDALERAFEKVVSGLVGGVRAYDYEVCVHALCFGGDVVREVRRYFSPKCTFAPCAEPEMMEVSFPLTGFKKWNELKSRSYGGIHEEVCPREIFSGQGAPISADV